MAIIREYIVDITSPAINISLNTITTDNRINTIEPDQAVEITESADGDFTAGDTVIVTVNGSSYTGAIEIDGSFSVSVPGSNLTAVNLRQ